jgi:hypothetical protein
VVNEGWQVIFAVFPCVTAAVAALASCALIQRRGPAGNCEPSPKEDGYRGIWYSNQPSNDEYRYKYSGGLGTFCANHLPIACYAAEAKKTFFVYGGTRGRGEGASLLAMASYYDHAAGLVPRPSIVMEKNTTDAHHNSTLSVDGDGHIWVFISAHGGKDGFIYRSRSPYSIDAFDRIEQHEFTYPQPWYMQGFGFLFLFTKYTAGRELYSRTSRDGIAWSRDSKYVGFGGHYQVSWKCGGKVGTAFMYHPPQGGLNARTNLYYLETLDCGESWRNASGQPIEVPLQAVENEARVHDYESEGWLVYINDLNFDKQGSPVILYVLSRGYESGPKNGPRIWTTARWAGDHWEMRPVTFSDHNYDMGSLYIEEDGTWRIIGPTEPGPQRYCTGGEVAMWTSRDLGVSWRRERCLTRDSVRNHSYVRRPVNAHPDFYAFWADGDGLQPSESRLYFTNRSGTAVWALPDKMTRDFEEPRRLKSE